jgi:thioredoxin reductase (NADPH)
MREASVRIVDALPEIGGQLTALYPEKWIYDVPGHPRIRARELVARHREQTLGQFDVPVHLSTTAERISHEDDGVVLHTDRGDLRSRTVVVAGGHGAFEPRRLTDLDLTPWLGRGAHEVLADAAQLAGRRVLVVGGGDSALDRVLDLAGVAERVGLVHRRERFRAHEVTVRRVLDAAQAGSIDLHVPYRIDAVHGNGAVEGVTLRHADGAAPPVDVPADAIVLQLGFRTALGPLAGWGFELDRGAIRVDPLMATSLDRVWACGDVTAFEGKLKLIATGYAEAATAVSQAVLRIRPETILQPGYSTNTGVPGAVEGQP